MKNLLANMKKGQSGIVEYIEFSNENIEFRRKMHLLEMGLTKGTKIKVKKVAPVGDPISIELRGYELCISKKDASKIIVRIWKLTLFYETYCYSSVRNINL